MIYNQDTYETTPLIIFKGKLITWKGTLCIMDRVSIDEVEQDESGNRVWLDGPYEMVGPFRLDELFTLESIRFAAVW